MMIQNNIGITIILITLGFICLLLKIFNTIESFYKLIATYLKEDERGDFEFYDLECTNQSVIFFS